MFCYANLEEFVMMFIWRISIKVRFENWYVNVLHCHTHSAIAN